MRSSLSCPLAHVKLTTPKLEHNIDAIIDDCKQRLVDDPNYQQEDYQKDYIRYKILKQTPKVKTPLPLNEFQAKPVKSLNQAGCIKTENSTFDFDEDVYKSFQSKFY